MLVQQPRGAVDVERVLGGGGEIGERRHERVQEAALAVRQRLVGEAGVQLARPQAEAGELVVEELRRPGDEAAVDGGGERQHALGDAAGRGDDHDHHDLRLQEQHLDVADRRGVQRRRRHDRQKVRDLRERLGRGAHRLVDLAAGELELQRRALALGRQQAVDEVAKAHIGRHAPGRRVRVGEQPVLLEHRQLVADGRRAGLQLGVGRQRARSHGLDGRLVGEHDLAQDQLLAGREHGFDCRSAFSGGRVSVARGFARVVTNAW